MVFRLVGGRQGLAPKILRRHSRNHFGRNEPQPKIIPLGHIFDGRQTRNGLVVLLRSIFNNIDFLSSPPAKPTNFPFAPTTR